MPTVLVDTTAEMQVNRTEVFAPVVTVTPYDTFEEAIALANDSDYGLQAGLVVNDISGFRMDHAPYGGVRRVGQSGREGPRYAIEEMTEERMMVFSP